MRILLDTHILIWWLSNDSRLSPSALSLLAEPTNTIFLSAASLWEIRIKQSIGRLRLPRSFDQALEQQGFEALSVNFSHTAALAMIPKLHKDPFDRMLLAQAISEKLQLLSADSALHAYGSPVLPA